MEKIQEILNKGWKTYTEKNKVIGYKKKVMKSIVEHINMYVMNVDMKR